jgi:hypothetical protein
LASAIERLARVGEQAGTSVEQMIQICDAGINVEAPLDIIDQTLQAPQEFIGFPLGRVATRLALSIRRGRIADISAPKLLPKQRSSEFRNETGLSALHYCFRLNLRSKESDVCLQQALSMPPIEW